MKNENKFEILGMKNDVILLKFTEGNFNDVNFSINLSDLTVTEKDDQSFLNFDIVYDVEDEKIKKFGSESFTNDVGKLILEMIEEGIVIEEEKEKEKEEEKGRDE